MKPDIHPEYRPVVFHDQSADESFITNSTMQTTETIEWEDGNTYPLAKVEISAASHPFFTGTMKIVDTAGRVERFERRYGRRKAAPAAEAPAAEAPAEKAEKKAPAAEAPAAKAPAAEEAPVAEAPVADAPEAETSEEE